MAKKISGAEYPLSKIFTSDFEYHIPPYQRPYAWTEEETQMLFSDLYDFFEKTTDEDYFLGSVVLIKEDNKPLSYVVDGQQRLTTLTLFFAVLAARFSGAEQANLTKYIIEQGDSFQNLKSAPRLYLRDKEQAFFQKYIQDNHIDDLIELDVQKQDTEAKRHIILNAKTLKENIDKSFGADIDRLKRFIAFLVQRCYLIVVSTPTQESAYRIFSVMNSRGLDLLPIDVIKADVIGAIPVGEQEKYTSLWEDMEQEATRGGFNELFMHIRTIFAKAKPQGTLYKEFTDYVIENVKSSTKLIDEYIQPYCDSFVAIRNSYFNPANLNGETNLNLRWLNKIDNADWMPLAIQFLTFCNKDKKYTEWFFDRLERLASCMLIMSKDVNYRIRRYSQVLKEIEEHKGHSLSDPLRAIELTQEEKDGVRAVLSGDIYLMLSRRRNYIILRLDSMLSDGAAIYNTSIFTIEHVLPQNVVDHSEWSEWWPDETLRQQWLHKLGNLVPLARKTNSAARNFDFNEKKDKYFKSPNNVSSYVLTTEVLNTPTWKPSDVEKRQNHLLDVFITQWGL